MSNFSFSFLPWVRQSAPQNSIPGNLLAFDVLSELK